MIQTQMRIFISSFKNDFFSCIIKFKTIVKNAFNYLKILLFFKYPNIKKLGTLKNIIGKKK